jgi:anti-sigma factor RsiW
VQTQLGAHLDGELGPRECERIRAHLRACPRCSGEAETLRATRALLRGLPEVETHPHLGQRVIARLRDGEGRADWLDRVGAWPAFASVRVPLAAAVALALVLVAVRQLGAPDPREAAEAGTRAVLSERLAHPPDLGLGPRVGASATPEPDAAGLDAARLDAVLERAHSEPDALLRAWRALSGPEREAWTRAVVERAHARGEAAALAEALRAAGRDAEALAARLEQ